MRQGDTQSVDDVVERIHALDPATCSEGQIAIFREAVSLFEQKVANAALVRNMTTNALGDPYRTPPTIITSRSREHERLIGALELEKGYQEAMKTQEFFGLLKASQPRPPLEQVLRAFTQEALEKAQEFQKPTLIVIPAGISFNDMVAAVNRHKTMFDQNDVYVSDLFHPHAHQETQKWQAHLVEGPREVQVQDFDDLGMTLTQRLAAFADYKERNKVNGMNRSKELQLMMQGLKIKKPIDVEGWTIQDEDPAVSTSRVPGARWSPDLQEVNFGWCHPEFRSGGARLRRSVEGDVPA